MTRNRVTDRLDHMLLAAGWACEYVRDQSKDLFLSDSRTLQAVCMNLVIIGELATQLITEHASFVSRYPEVPWRNIRGMRNRIAHGYFDIDAERVWQTVQSALPDLIRQLNEIRILEDKSV